MRSIHGLPAVDISPLLDRPARTQCAETVKEVRQACEDVGVLYITGHGVDEMLIGDALEEARKFFQSTLEQKMKIDIAASPVHRGYVGYKKEKTKGKEDLHEAVDFGRDIPIGHPDAAKFPLFGPNQWPLHLKTFRHSITSYYAAMQRVGLAVGRGMLYGLDAPDEFIERTEQDSVDVMRLIYYPNQEDGQGIGEHVDYGIATILAQDTAGGLEVRTNDGEWKEAPAVEGALPVVIGKMMQVTSNGVYRATVHRVQPTKQERYSAPFFHGPNYDAIVQPLQSLCTDEAPAKYVPYHYGDAVLAAFKKSYD